MVLIPIRGWDSVTQEAFFPVTRTEALAEQEKLLKEWEPASEVRVLRFGSAIVGATASFSSVAINNLFRAKLKLQTHNLSMSSFLAMIVPGTLSAFSYDHFITNNVMLYKAQCPMCYELKAALMINCLAVLFPLASLPWLNLGIAAGIGLRVPYAYEIKEVAQFWWSVVKPASTHLSYIVAINAIVASTISYKQAVSMEVIADILLNMDKDLKNKSSEFWKNNNNEFNTLDDDF